MNISYTLIFILSLLLLQVSPSLGSPSLKFRNLQAVKGPNDGLSLNANLDIIQYQGASLGSPQSDVLLKNIQKINFIKPGERYSWCCGQVKILNQSSFEVLRANGTTVLATSTFGLGRGVVLAVQTIFQEQTLVSDKNWVFLLRNMIRWAAKNEYPNYNILVIGLYPTNIYRSLLKRAGLSANFTFISSFNDLLLADMQKYHVLMVGEEFTSQFVSATDFTTKIHRYVSNGGGIISSFSYYCYGCYLNPANCTLTRQCLHNRLLSPMGIQFLDSRYVNVDQILFNTTDTMPLQPQQIKQYIKMNQTFNSSNYGFMRYGADWSKILQGVQNVSYDGKYFSSFSFFQDQNFPVLSTQNKPIMVGGRYGFGKLFFSGETNILYNVQASNIKLVSNVIRWLCGNKTQYNIGFLFMNYSSSMTVFQKIPQNNTRSEVNLTSQFAGKDILVVGQYKDLYPAGLTAAFLTQLVAYVGRGGSILFSANGWDWSYSGAGYRNKSLVYETSFASYVIASKFNVFLRTDWYRIYNLTNINYNQRNVTTQNFLKNDFLPLLKGNRTAFLASNAVITTHINFIKMARNYSNICDIQLYHELVNCFITSRYNIEKFYEKMYANDTTYNNVWLLLNTLSYAMPEDQRRAIPPSLNKYPGTAKKKLQNSTVNVFMNKNQRIYTGLYLNPGQSVKVKHNGTLQEAANITLMINYNDYMYNKAKILYRFPDINFQYKLKARQFLISSPHGGLLWFQVSSKSNVTRPISFIIYGAYQSIYFNQDLHPFPSFQTIKYIESPFFIFQSKNFIIIGPTHGIFASFLFNPQKIANYYNRALTLVKQFRGFEINPFLKDSILNDVNIGLGLMHSGNPVMSYDYDWFEFLGWKKDPFVNGPWGLYHQLGHNHQDWKWDPYGFGQVTCNLYPLYINYMLHNQTVFQTDYWFIGSYYQDLMVLFNNLMNLTISQRRAPFEESTHLGLYFFAILIEDFGFSAFSTLHRVYDQLNISPGNDDVIYDLFCQMISKVTGSNLWVYCRNWGLPVTELSRSRLNTLGLRTYTCKRHPILTTP